MSSKTKDIKWFGMKLTPKQKQKIQKLAKQRGVSQKDAVMELVDEAVEEKFVKAPHNSFLEGIEHLSGSLNGPGDLSTNPERMKGYGQ